MRKRQVHASIDEETKAKLKKLAKRENRSLSGQLRHLIKRALMAVSESKGE